MKFLRLKEWAKYQHYRDRNPPWIKLHQELLGSFTWVTLDAEGRMLAIACMLLAAKTGNKIPLDRDYIQRAAYLKDRPDVRPLLDCGFAELIEEGPESIEHTPFIQEKPIAEAPTLADASELLANDTKRYDRDRGRDREEKERSKAFVQPTLAEVSNYCKERNKGVDPEKWMAYYEANGWYVGRHKMKNWKSAVVYWEKKGWGGPFDDGNTQAGRSNGTRTNAQKERAVNNVAAVLAAFPELDHGSAANRSGQAARHSGPNTTLLEGETKAFPR